MYLSVYFHLGFVFLLDLAMTLVFVSSSYILVANLLLLLSYKCTTVLTVCMACLSKLSRFLLLVSLIDSEHIV